MSSPFSDLFAAMLDVARGSLTHPVSRWVIPPGGLVVWDECCEGQLHLQPLTMTPLSRIGKCDQPWTVRAALGVIRCVHTIDDFGTPPSQAEISEDGISALDDAYDLSCVIKGKLATVPGVMNIHLERWVPLGVEGGCGGGEWEFTFTWLGCNCV